MKKTFALLVVLCLCFLHCSAFSLSREDLILWDDLPPNAEGQSHVLLLCVDQWEASPRDLGNTDGIVLVTLDTRAHRVMLTSVIRDAMVKGPDMVSNKINRIARLFSPEDLCVTLSQHLGVRIENFILFDFQQIANIVDHLGGVDVTLNAAEIDYLNRYALSRSAADRPLTKPGVYHFNGYAAVIYMRIRKAGGGGDLMRTQRARNVLSALADQCREISYDDARLLVSNILGNTTVTNMNLDEMMRIMDQAYSLRDCTMEELRIPPDGLGTPMTDDQSVIQDVNWPGCREVFLDFLSRSLLTE